MGNCQAAEVAVVMIQHPGGRVERLYWPTSAADVMKSNPGFYVALVTLYVSEEKPDGGGDGAGGGTVRLTRVRLLKAKDMLLLGQVYRLIASQEVVKALRQRKYEKLKKSQAAEMMRKKQQQEHEQNHQEKSEKAHQHQAATSRQEKERQKNSAQMAARGRQWRPSLQSISENRKPINIDHGEEEEL